MNFELKAVNDRTVVGSTASEPIKIMQREQDPITAFAVSQSNFGWIVVATGREMQEMDISPLLEPHQNWLYDQAELDVQLLGLKKNILRDNDDYLLIQAPKDEPPKSHSDTMVIGRGTSFVSGGGNVFFCFCF